MASWMDRAQRAAEVLRRGRVLVVSGSDEHAGAIAHALTDLDLIPVLAFDAESARRTADGVSCNIAVLDVCVVDGSPLPLIRDLAELVGAGVLVLGRTDEPADRLFDAGAFLLGSSDWSGLHVAARSRTGFGCGRRSRAVRRLPGGHSRSIRRCASPGGRAIRSR